MLNSVASKIKEKIIEFEDYEYITESGTYSFTYKTNNINIVVSKNIEVIINNYYENIDNININYVIATNSNVAIYSYSCSTINKISKININENSKVNTYFLELGKYSKSETEINLIGYGAEISYNLATYIDGKIKNKYKKNINHLNKNTISTINNYAVLDGESTVEIDVISFIKKGYNNSKVHQNTKVISLSEKTNAVLNPTLLIDEFNIEGGHGATFGTITKEEMYYLKSRGISELEAKKLIVIGTLLNNAPDEIRNQLIEILDGRFKNELS